MLQFILDGGEFVKRRFECHHVLSVSPHAGDSGSKAFKIVDVFERCYDVCSVERQINKHFDSIESLVDSIGIVERLLDKS